MSKDHPKPLSPGGKKIEFHYIKSPLYRGIHVDGGFGGLTPRGLLHLSLYSERKAIPQITVHAVKESTEKGIRLGDEIREERVEREGIVRELEISLYMDMNAALTLRDWLNSRLHEANPTKGAEGVE